MADQTNNVNLNATECLGKTYDIGSTTIRNICSGAESVIPWGSLDWAAFVTLGVLFGAVTALVVGLVIYAAREWVSSW